MTSVHMSESGAVTKLWNGEFSKHAPVASVPRCRLRATAAGSEPRRIEAHVEVERIEGGACLAHDEIECERLTGRDDHGVRTSGHQGRSRGRVHEDGARAQQHQQRARRSEARSHR
jgi:hypothetical protein